MKQLILNSGGFDSVVLLNAVMDNENPDKEKECLFFNWGQANKEQELEKAKKSCDKFGIPLHVIDIPSAQIWGSVIMDKDDPYIPMRNMVFLSIAVAFAQKNGFDEIFVAFIKLPNKEDYYVDSTQEFVDNLNTTIEETGITIRIPIIDNLKTTLGYLAKQYNISKDDFFSCNTPTPGGEPCGVCQDCILVEDIYHRIFGE